MVTLVGTSKFKLEVTAQDKTLVMRPTGDVDEDVNFLIVMDFIRSNNLTIISFEFDLSGIRTMNSCGIRAWILFMERLGNQYPLKFVKMSEAFLEQANMVSGMLGKGDSPQVTSFFVPYFCAKCDSNFSVLLDPSRVQGPGGEIQIPPASCTKCSGALEFDAIEEEYFVFLEALS